MVLAPVWLPLHVNFNSSVNWLMFINFLIGILSMHSRGNTGLTRYVGSSALYRLAGRNALLLLLLVAVGLISRLPLPSFNSWALLWLLLTGFTGSLRFAMRDLLLNLRSQHKQQLRVAIYGAGEAGAQRQPCVWLVIIKLSLSR